MVRYEYLTLVQASTSDRLKPDVVTPTWTTTFRVYGPQAGNEADETHDANDISLNELLNRLGAQGWRLVEYHPVELALFGSDHVPGEVSGPISEVYRFIREVDQ